MFLLQFLLTLKVPLHASVERRTSAQKLIAHDSEFPDSSFLECVWRDTIRAMDTNAANAVLGANSAIALSNFMNDPTVASRLS